MAIIDCFDKRTGITYVYESHSYREKGTGKVKARRKLLGKRDPQTGALLPTRPKKNTKTTSEESSDINGTTSETDPSQLVSILVEKTGEITALKKRIASLEKKLSSIEGILEKASAIVNQGK